MINAGIIGCGRIAGYFEKDLNLNTHAGAYLFHKSFELKTCYDIINSKSLRFAKKYKCISSSSIENMLNKHNLHVVSITTPDKTHYNIVKKILEYSIKPKLIFVEKPICQSKDEFEELLALSRINRVPIVVNLSRRFDEYHNFVKNLINNQELGVPISVIGTYYGGIKHNGIHLIDTLFYVLEDNIIVDEVFNKVEKFKKKDPTIEFRLKTKKGKYPIHIFGVDEKYFQLFEIEIRFTNGRIRLEDFGNIIKVEKKYINKYSENILIPFNKNIKKTKSGLINALDIIAGYLLEGKCISEFELISNYKSMNLIWEIENEYKNKFN